MSPSTQVQFITKELHLMNKEFVEMGKRITEIDMRSKYQEERINELLANNKDVINSIKELHKTIAENKLDNNKAYNKLDCAR